MSAGADYRTAPSRLKWSRWLTADIGQRLYFAFNIAADGLRDLVVEGVKKRFPGQANDALPYLARDRNLDRGPSEPAASFEARLSTVFDTDATLGHPRELLDNVLPYLLPDTPLVRTVSDQAVWDTVSGGVWSKLYESGNWIWDGSVVVKWWRAWALIYTNTFTSTRKWGDGGKWGDKKGTWGSSATSTQVAAIRALCIKYKPANSYMVAIGIAFDHTLFDPTLTFGSSKLPDGHWGRRYKSVAGVATPSRPTCSVVCFWPGGK